MNWQIIATKEEKMSVGNRVLEGDEYWSTSMCKWIPVSKSSEILSCLVYRRPISEPVDPEPTKPLLEEFMRWQAKLDACAFPFRDKDGSFGLGLTKLEWFAGMAIQGILTRNEPNPPSLDDKVNEAFCYASSMLEESKRISEKQNKQNETTDQKQVE